MRSDQDLFVATYRNRFLPIFRPYGILGLPAVDRQRSRDSTSCTTTVGVADFQTLDVNGSLGQRSYGERETDACAVSRRAAEEIVATLPPA